MSLPLSVTGWKLPAVGFFLYSMIAIGAHILDARVFLIIGGAILFICVCAEWCRGVMAVSVDKTVIIVLCILLLSIFTTLHDPTNSVFHNLSKHVTVCILYVFILSMGLAPVYSTPFRSVFILILLFMGLVSFFVPNISETARPLKIGSSRIKNAPSIAASAVRTIGFARTAPAHATVSGWFEEGLDDK